jgi:endonuclease I
MRRIPVPFLAALLALAFAPAPASSGVFLSELCDPQNNYQNDRYIEIYNPGPGAVDLTGWRIVAIGNNVDVNTWTLSGSIAAGEAKVAGSTAPVTSFPIHWASASWLTNYTNWNGNVGDGAKLIDHNNAILDQIVAPGSGLFENKTLVRAPSVTTGSPSYNSLEWSATPVLTSPQASPGSHNGSTPPAGGPVITNIVTDPASPPAGVPVDVQATVVDTSGIEGVTLLWGTSAGTLSNVIGMPLLAGDTYRTSGQIPGQASGVTIYYRVEAVGGAATTQSAILNYLIPGGGTGVPPSILAVGEMSETTFLVFFSETVEEVSAEMPSNYAIGGLGAITAERDPANPAQVLVTIPGVQAGTRTMTVSGVADLDGNFTANAQRQFNYVDVSIPAGYYAGTEGLSGMALRAKLQDILSPHNVGSYAGALTAFQTTDVKPNGKVWDMYSDVPGGTPPYEYSFGQTGQGATEGLGYNREHSWPDSWFNGASPMHTDLWILYPTDAKVNGYRSNFAYGEVDVPSVTSLNGSKLGSSASPGYAGTVFEPIDAYKGDLARGQFYVSTRYYGQDGSWAGGGSAEGADILPWAISQFVAWSNADPVSWKERMRNGAVYAIQGNRNPFIDHPEFVTLVFDSASVVGVGGGGNAGGAKGVRLRANVPNPFVSTTSITFDLARSERVSARVFDVSGRLVRTLAAGDVMESGPHRVDWNGADDAGARVGAGLYFVRIDTGVDSATRRMVLAR